MREHRLPEISVLDIAKKATVNRATFYAHFEDKHAIMTSVLKDDLHEVLKSQFTECPAFDRASFLKIATAIYKFLYTLRTQCPATVSELNGPLASAVQDTLYEMIVTLHQHHKPTGVIESHSAETLATVISWSIYGGACEWIQTGRKVSAEKHAAKILDLIFREAA